MWIDELFLQNSNEYIDHDKIISRDHEILKEYWGSESIEMNRNKMIKIEMHGIILCHFNPLRHLDERYVDVKSSKIVDLGLEI